MNIIKQYAISHDLSIDEVEMVAQYVNPLDTVQFERELESMRVIDSMRLDQIFAHMLADHFETIQQTFDTLI